jgi:hypothetical protein
MTERGVTWIGLLVVSAALWLAVVVTAGWWVWGLVT